MDTLRQIIVDAAATPRENRLALRDPDQPGWIAGVAHPVGSRCVRGMQIRCITVQTAHGLMCWHVRFFEAPPPSFKGNGSDLWIPLTSAWAPTLEAE